MMFKLQLDRYEGGYSHEIWKEYYCLGKIHASEALNSKLIRCQNSCQFKNLKILTTFQRDKSPYEQSFSSWIFYVKEQGYKDITRAKINLGSHHIHT